MQFIVDIMPVAIEQRCVRAIIQPALAQMAHVYIGLVERRHFELGLFEQHPAKEGDVGDSAKVCHWRSIKIIPQAELRKVDRIILFRGVAIGPVYGWLVVAKVHKHRRPLALVYKLEEVSQRGF